MPFKDPEVHRAYNKAYYRKHKKSIIDRKKTLRRVNRNAVANRNKMVRYMEIEERIR